jgi:hypothetical protein
MADVTFPLNDREQYALACWLTEAEAPKGLTRRRQHYAVVDRLELEPWVDLAQPAERCGVCQSLKRKGLREIAADSNVVEVKLDEPVARYLLEVLDAEDRAMNGVANLILLPLAERIRDALAAAR